MESKAIVRKMSRVGIWGNIFLSAFKLFAGIIGKSGAMISDAVHSLSDVFATLIAWIGVRMSQRQEDAEHPYGHERFECVASLILGLILAGTGIGIGYSGIRKLIAGSDALEIPTVLPLIAAIVSIGVKEGMFHYTMYYAGKLDSAAFRADAWHHRSDAISSVGSFIGIGMAKLGIPVMDPIASLIICVLILKVAFDITKDAIEKMLDTSCDNDFEQKVRVFIEEQPGTGLEWNENLPVSFVTYTVRTLDGLVSDNTDEQWAKQLGTWNQTYYYGPQVLLTGKEVSYAGIDALLDGMKIGGTRTAIIPSWMCTTSRFDTVDEYLKNGADGSSVTAIYTVNLQGQVPNLAEYEMENLRRYSAESVTDTLSTAAVFFKSFTEFDKEPAEMPNDTTVYIDYIGRRVSDNQVFDTTIADTAKFYNIYNPAKTYAPIAVKMAENAADVTISSVKVKEGFGHGLKAMHAGEKASFAFGYNLGYGSTGSGDLIPRYAALRFDVELVPEP